MFDWTTAPSAAGYMLSNDYERVADHLNQATNSMGVINAAARLHRFAARRPAPAQARRPNRWEARR